MSTWIEFVQRSTGGASKNPGRCEKRQGVTAFRFLAFLAKTCTHLVSIALPLQCRVTTVRTRRFRKTGFLEAFVSTGTKTRLPSCSCFDQKARERLGEANIMKRPDENKEREERIDDEIVVDCYNEEERAMGWYYYAESNITFPFNARCVAKRASSPLKIGETMEVERMASEDDCASELMVLIKWNDQRLAVPLMQLKPSTASTEKTREVAADWHYWVARGYEF